MFLDPDQLQNVPSSEILHQATAGRLGIDQRFFSALLGRREETIAALVEWANRDREDDPVNLEMEIVGLIHALKAAEGMPFLLDAIRIAPDEIPDEVVEAIHVFGADAVEPLLELYEELGEAAGGEVSFLLASLETRDPRILDLLRERLDYDAADGAFLLGVYGDPTARLILETTLASLSANDQALKTEFESALSQLSSEPAQREETPFRVSENYPEKADPPIEILPDDARVEFLSHPVASVRAEAAHSFFNKELDSVLSSKLVALAKSDPDITVRSSAWESLADATDRTEVVEAMLTALRDAATPIQERASVLIGLSAEVDRNEVRAALEKIYDNREVRAKALEAMWRSVHPTFRDRFAPNLDDEDIEVRRSAIWGVGYFAVRSCLDRLRGFFGDDDLRPDALFAYALALPGDTSKGRIRSLFSRVEKDAGGLSVPEEELVKVALDERLVLSGKEPFFSLQE